MNVVCTILLVIVISTGFVREVAESECWKMGKYYDASELDDMTAEERKAECMIYFHEAFYFTIVTFSTVGYGDIAPTGTLGRMMIVFFILASDMCCFFLTCL